MAIDHKSPFKEIRLKSRRTMSCGGPEPQKKEDEERAAASDPELEEKDPAGSAHGARWPRWVRPLLSARFYTACEAHPSSRRGGERTMFCLDCADAGALCLLCVAHGHLGHRAIQIRRSTYNSVVRVSDIRGLLDIDGVQTYVINGARVVFINERRPRHNHKGAGYKGVKGCCETCGRGLHDVFRFCSLGCKVAAGCSPDGNAVKQSSTPPPSPSPPPAVPAKRRKGIPRRAPFR
ncbi:uncharacterized protein LOC100824979 [Brachypodium distachyon]|uniref:B box-type domain-containing protein n=1 Tax=Brachypodium distachyon TaxID=15368 RepID=I1HMM1_BRADI|nr:uncharacterized protein LOC100824979 [Brachypodium distachyon]XP_024315266.1 uncharacterized protein LOC100824979 [Brachypodium distachyon]KQK07871.1 hypothetical protein BRADI_2g38150v3 [Brachypodium distachyon]|eukprot:XP_014754276.1 uncharacterized protein LOC100824979 [Brachypodium distachyon]